MLVSALWLWPALFSVIDTIGQQRLHGGEPASWRDLFFSSGDWLIYAFITPAIFWVSHTWPVVRPHVIRRALVHLAFAALFCVAWAVGGKILQAGLAFIFQRESAGAALSAADADAVRTIGIDVLSWILTTLPFGAVVYLCVAGMAHAFQYFVEARDRDVQVARLSEQLTTARLSALQARLNPHFLFNSLNTIAVLTRDGDTRAATRVVEQLSEVLRSTLGRADVNEVSVEDELDLVRQYLAVEQARFPDRLRPEIDVDPATLSAAVPSFALQHLVENALKHGIARRTDAGRVSITVRRDGDMLELAVEDDGPGIAAHVDQLKGHGLEHTRERLRTLYQDDRASLVVIARPGGGTIARLRVPYREMLLETEG
jgi:two-component system, LytTR family, sensor kinase